MNNMAELTKEQQTVLNVLKKYGIAPISADRLALHSDLKDFKELSNSIEMVLFELEAMGQVKRLLMFYIPQGKTTKV
jgi:hypothetical protein